MTENSNPSPSVSQLPKLTYRLWTVWRRNLDVFMKKWHVNFMPSLIEPILYLLAFGFGLGTFVTNIKGISYMQWIAPGLVAVTVMYGAFFECTYGSFVRMYFQRTFDAIIATPINVEEVIAGELLWGATRATINSAIVLAVVAAFGLISSPWFLAMLPVAFFGGLLFA
jgi:lipooligosaccharide transport system permease protein